MAISLHVSSCACMAPLRRPRLLNQFAIPGPDRRARTWRQPWANITTPTQTRASKRAKLTAFTTPPSIAAGAPPPKIGGLRPGVQQVARVAAVDIADERRVDVVAQQLLQAAGEVTRRVGGDGEDVVLDRAQPGGRVVEHHAQAGGVGAVGAAAVPQAADVEQGRTGRDLGGDEGRLGTGLLVDPAVAAGD